MRLPALTTCLVLAACGRYNLPAFAPQDSGATPDAGATPDTQDAAAKATVGPVDLTQAPPTLGLTCPATASALAFRLPCLVGLDLIGQDLHGVGLHEIECRSAEANEPVVWSFLLPLGALAMHPELTLAFPSDQLPSPPPTSGAIDVGGERARVSDVRGTLSFTRVDPVARAFEGSFTGTMVLKGESSGTAITCTLDGPLWGAPGGFL